MIFWPTPKPSASGCASGSTFCREAPATGRTAGPAARSRRPPRSARPPARTGSAPARRPTRSWPTPPRPPAGGTSWRTAPRSRPGRRRRAAARPRARSCAAGRAGRSRCRTARSPTPSLNVICQRAERCLSSSARAFARVSSATSGSSCSGFSCTASSARIPRAELLATASTSWLVERRSSSSARADHPAQQELDQRPEARLVHQLGVLRLRGVQPQRGRDGERVGADPGGVEVAAVQLHDPSPVRVEVGLGDHARDVRAQLHRRAEELQLRARVLLRGVGDQQHGVRAGQRRHRGRPVRRAEPADARGVDEHEPAFEELARQPDLGVGEHRLVAGVARLADVLGELVHRHLGALGRPRRASRGRASPRRSRRAARRWARPSPRRRRPGRRAR